MGGSGRAWLLETKLKSEPLSRTHELATLTRSLGQRPSDVPALDFFVLRNRAAPDSEDDEEMDDGTYDEESYASSAGGGAYYWQGASPTLHGEAWLVGTAAVDPSVSD